MEETRQRLQEKVSVAEANVHGDKEEIKQTYEKTHGEFIRAQEKLRQAEILQTQQHLELQTVKDTVQQMNNESSSMSTITLVEDEICVDDVVMMKAGIGIVVIRYVGPIEGKNPNEEWVGYEVSDPNPEGGFCDGEFEGVRYFETADYCANFAPMANVKKRITPAQLLQQLHGVMKQIERGGSAKE